MRILAVDDEKIALEVLVDAINEASPLAEVFPFSNSREALKWIKENSCDIVFLDIEMPGLNGIEVAKQIKLISPRTNIIFATAYGEYRKEAFELHASGYITKPAMVEDIEKEIDELRYPVQLKSVHPLRIQTFGYFEVFLNDIPIKLGNKMKELFAFLVDRSGASATNNEMYDILYEGEFGHEETFKKTKKALLDKLKDLNCENVIIKQWGKLALNTNLVDCDLYEWRAGKAYAINLYKGEYMAQYSWAEFSKCEFGAVSE